MQVSEKPATPSAPAAVYGTTGPPRVTGSLFNFSIQGPASRSISGYGMGFSFSASQIGRNRNPASTNRRTLSHCFTLDVRGALKFGCKPIAGLLQTGQGRYL